MQKKLSFFLLSFKHYRPNMGAPGRSDFHMSSWNIEPLMTRLRCSKPGGQGMRMRLRNITIITIVDYCYHYQYSYSYSSYSDYYEYC